MHFHGPKPHQRSLLHTARGLAQVVPLLPLLTSDYDALTDRWEQSLRQAG